MEATLFDHERPLTRAGIVPREYQTLAHDACFREWGNGQPGALIRLFTGGGKTLTACLVADTWLRRSDSHRVMVVSYERQLVSQFAEEIEDYLGIEPGIEMESEEATAANRIVVASRQTLLPSTPPTQAQAAELASHGIRAMDVHSKRLAETYLRHLRKGGDRGAVIDNLIDQNRNPLLVNGVLSRLHKFDWRLPWLVIFDEAHRHAYKLSSVGHIVDWFGQNPEHRRTGLTATPKRADGVSLGDVMFPAVAIDYPLYSLDRPSAVRDGWARPYKQRYIEVEGVDFKSLKRVSESEGADFDEEALARTLGEEATLAKLVGPLLDMVGDRQTLIFSPGVQMAQDVARFINVRCQTTCACGKVAWYPSALVGDGLACACGRPITADEITRGGEQARQLDGTISDKQRRPVYRAHKRGEFQFLSVCGLCREGYNDPDISCVAVFRPVSKKASSLAEQMKGRACRPPKSVAKLLHTLPTAAARCQAIADVQRPEYPDGLIVDLVGVTGLADCASTVEIYADGLPDEVKARAAEILAGQGQTAEADVDEAIAKAQREAEETRERIRREREAAERRAKEEYERRSKAQAEARYTSQEIGYGSQADPHAASDAQYRFAAFLGMEVKALRSRKQIGRIIGQLRVRTDLAEVARSNGLEEGQWEPRGPTPKQQNLLRRLGLPVERAKSPGDAGLLLDARLDPEKFVQDRRAAIGRAKNGEELTGVAMDVALVRGVLRAEPFWELVRAGMERRKAIQGAECDEPIPD